MLEYINVSISGIFVNPKLMGLQAKTATVIRDGVEEEIAIEEVVVDDIILVRPGQKIPVDGVVVEGNSAVDELNKIDSGFYLQYVRNTSCRSRFISTLDCRSSNGL